MMHLYTTKESFEEVEAKPFLIFEDKSNTVLDQSLISSTKASKNQRKKEKKKQKKFLKENTNQDIETFNIIRNKAKEMSNYNSNVGVALARDKNGLIR
mmetsp:Transcript_42924/g.41274  ORF Transcript_42924/g.41274 Transcript_42924/m.41274 type:complete len:98 (+) Transcript_42924:255-548(+)